MTDKETRHHRREAHIDLLRKWCPPGCRVAVNVQHVTRAGWRQCSVLCIVGLPKCTVEATMRDAEIVNVALYVGDILNLRVNFDRGTVACQDPQTMIERLGEALWGDRQAFRMNRI